MKWFKHDSRAHQDPKLVYLRIEYGMEGYGLYWYLLEHVAAGVGEPDFDFILDPDPRVIAYETRIDEARVMAILDYMVELGLFSREGGVVSCPKMLDRMDSSMISNPQLRKRIKEAKSKAEAQKKRPEAKTVTRPDVVMIESDGASRTTDARLLDKIRYISRPQGSIPTEISNIYTEGGQKEHKNGCQPGDVITDPDDISAYQDFMDSLAGQGGVQ